MEFLQKLRRVVIILSFWIGVGAVIMALILFLTHLLISPSAVLGVGFVLLAINIFTSGELSPGFSSRTYTIKGQLVRGLLEANTGWNDLIIGACENDRVAQVLYGPFGSPEFNLEGGEAHLKLSKEGKVNLSRWEAFLAPNLLWDLRLKSSGGYFSIDLSTLRVSHLDAETGSGEIALKGAPRVFAEVALRSSQGDIQVTIPEGIGVDIQMELGDDARLMVKNQRLKPLSLNRYAIPELEAQIALKITTTKGDVILN